MLPEQWKSKCTVCKKEFTYPEFHCSALPGNHRVEGKTYYHFGGRDIQNERDRRNFGINVVLHAPPDILDKESGSMVTRMLANCH